MSCVPEPKTAAKIGRVLASLHKPGNRLFRTFGALLLAITLAVPATDCSVFETGESLQDLQDDVINANLKASLYRDPLNRSALIDATTVNGTVILNGSVETPQQKQRAEQIARNTRGVQSVVNYLTVRPRNSPNKDVD
jgi:hyperosmotically inducible periplasmic protein